jgi:hypothetical protein
MFPEIERFKKWLRCRSPQATTHVHYTNDVKLFFTLADKPPAAITLHDMDAYVTHCWGLTINQRLSRDAWDGEGNGAVTSQDVANAPWLGRKALLRLYPQRDDLATPNSHPRQG